MIRFKFDSLLIAMLSASLCIGATSCGRLILEDRTECPAFLFFNITNAELFDVSEHAFVAAYKYPENDLLAKDTTTVRSIQDKEFYLQVKRSDSVVGYGVLCFDGAHNDGTLWTVKPGEEFPPLWRFEFKSPAASESYIIPVEAVKDHSRITLRFTEADLFPGTGGEFPYSVIVRSNTCGIDAMDGEPVKGEFRFEPVEYAVGEFRFCVPRQFDRAMHVEVVAREGISELEGVVMDIPLWNLLREKEDFSWTAKNLADAVIEVSITENKYNVIVVDWNGDSGWEYYL